MAFEKLARETCPVQQRYLDAVTSRLFPESFAPSLTCARGPQSALIRADRVEREGDCRRSEGRRAATWRRAAPTEKARAPCERLLCVLHPRKAASEEGRVRAALLVARSLPLSTSDAEGQSLQSGARSSNCLVLLPPSPASPLLCAEHVLLGHEVTRRFFAFFFASLLAVRSGPARDSTTWAPWKEDGVDQVRSCSAHIPSSSGSRVFLSRERDAQRAKGRCNVSEPSGRRRFRSVSCSPSPTSSTTTMAPP